jgi:NRAMP (natural resistance-associated macrophage protein)-like metal ion transporter
MKGRFKKFFRSFGPGIVTGAADDDPSGIATYSQAGAQFGYNQLWTALYMLPFLIAIQELCARIGAVTGGGISSAVKKHYSKKVLFAIVLLIVVANIINIGADINAMAAATKLIFPLNLFFLMLFFALLILTLEIFVRYKNYANILKWLCLSLIAYPLTLFLMHQPWMMILKATFIPHLEWNFQFLFIITGVLGTTISPYMFFWQASQVTEERKEAGYKKSTGKSNHNQKFIQIIRVDNFVGMCISEFTTWCIIVVGATVLHTNGITNINTAADAAKALEPLVQSFPNAGFVAKLIFATGIVGLGFLSVPVLAGSSAYALSSALGFPKGLDLKLSQAKFFYGVIIVSTTIGLLFNFSGISPIKLLIYSAVINGIVAVPLIFIIALIGKNEKIMGRYKSGWLSNSLVWLTFMGMGAAAVTMFFAHK